MGKEVSTSSTRQDKIVDKNYFTLLSVTFSSRRYKILSPESESDNLQEFPLESSCIVFNWKHKYFEYVEDNMCS